MREIHHGVTCDIPGGRPWYLFRRKVPVFRIPALSDALCNISYDDRLFETVPDTRLTKEANFGGRWVQEKGCGYNIAASQSCAYVVRSRIPHQLKVPYGGVLDFWYLHALVFSNHSWPRPCSTSSPGDYRQYQELTQNAAHAEPHDKTRRFLLQLSL